MVSCKSGNGQATEERNTVGKNLQPYQVEQGNVQSSNEREANFPEKIIGLILGELEAGIDPCKLAGEYGVSTNAIMALQKEREDVAEAQKHNKKALDETGNESSLTTGRYTLQFKEEVLAQVASGRKCTDVAKQYGITVTSLYRWKKQAKMSGGKMPKAKSTKPPNNASPINEEHSKLVLDLKEDRPNMGPAQIQDQLKRFHALKISRHTIVRILNEAGIPLQKRSSAVSDNDPAKNRFEMSRPNELWAIDFKEFWIHSEKAYGLFVLDDFSRFCVGFALTQNPTADLAIQTVNDVIQRYGRPERMLSDRGPQFHAWNGVSRFSKFLGDFVIEHSVTKAQHCFTNGKIEAFNRTLDDEVLNVVELASLKKAEEHFIKFLDTYNFFRTHMGINGLVPADRYFGMVHEAQQALLEGVKNTGAGLKWLRGIMSDDGPALRLPTLFQLVSHDGIFELIVLGKRFKLG